MQLSPLSQEQHTFSTFHAKRKLFVTSQALSVHGVPALRPNVKFSDTWEPAHSHCIATDIASKPSFAPLFWAVLGQCADSVRHLFLRHAAARLVRHTALVLRW